MSMMGVREEVGFGDFNKSVHHFKDKVTNRTRINNLSMRLFYCLHFKLAPSSDAAVDDESEIICVGGGEKVGLAGVFPSGHQCQHLPPPPSSCQPSLTAVQYLNKIYS